MTEVNAELKIGNKTVAEYHLKLSELFANHDSIVIKAFNIQKAKSNMLVSIYTQYLKGFKVTSETENYEDLPNRYCWLCGICSTCNTEYKITEQIKTKPKCSKCNNYTIRLTKIYNDDTKCPKCNGTEINLISKQLVYSVVLEKKGILR